MTCMTAARTLLRNPDIWVRKSIVSVHVCQPHFTNRHRAGNSRQNVECDKGKPVVVFSVSSFPSSVNHCGLLVRSLAFPSLQPSLVQSFSPFPIIQCTNRKRRTELGSSAETDRVFVTSETQSEYHLLQ